jgi:hypothetical protein
MKLEKVLSVAVTEEEYNIILKKLSEAIVKDGKAYSMSKFLRANMISPFINGSAPQETPTVTNPEDKPMIDSEWNDL